MKVEIKFEKEKCKIEKFVWHEAYTEFGKWLKNIMIEHINVWEYDKADIVKSIYEKFLFIEINKKKSWH